MRLYQHCQNPACGRDLDEVTPPLRRDAKFCGGSCKSQARHAAQDDLPHPGAVDAFRQGMAARRTVRRPSPRRLRERERRARRVQA